MADPHPITQSQPSIDADDVQHSNAPVVPIDADGDDVFHDCATQEFVGVGDETSNLILDDDAELPQQVNSTPNRPTNSNHSLFSSIKRHQYSPVKDSSDAALNSPPRSKRKVKISDFFSKQADKPSKPTKSSGGGTHKDELVPRSKFLLWIRDSSYSDSFNDKIEYEDAEILKDIKHVRQQLIFNFKAERQTTNQFTNSDRSLRSNSNIVDWSVDQDAFNLETTDRRRLSRYPIENLMVSLTGTKFLLLVAVDDDAKCFNGLAASVESLQLSTLADGDKSLLGRVSISGRKHSGNSQIERK